MKYLPDRLQSYVGWLLYLIGLGVAVGSLSGFSAAERAITDQQTARLAMQADTVTVEGQVVYVGNEPFTRLRLMEKGGGGYVLTFEGEDTIELRRNGPTDVRIVGVPYRDTWQGKETPHLRVIRWNYVDG